MAFTSPFQAIFLQALFAVPAVTQRPTAFTFQQARLKIKEPENN